MAYLEDPLNLCEALKSEDASKWEAAMQEESNSLMANGMWKLTNLPKIARVYDANLVLRQE